MKLQPKEITCKAKENSMYICTYVGVYISICVFLCLSLHLLLMPVAVAKAIGERAAKMDNTLNLIFKAPAAVRSIINAIQGKA